MSGGSLNYWNANDPIEEIKKRLMFAKGRYSPETIQVMQDAIKAMRKAEIYSHRLEWMFSGDDGEESLHERLAEDLQELSNEKDIPIFSRHCRYCENFRDGVDNPKGSCYYDRDYWYYKIDHPDEKSMYERFKDDATDCYDFEPSCEAIYEIEHPKGEDDEHAD